MNNVKLLHIKCCFFQFFNSPVALKNLKNSWPSQEKVEMTPLLDIYLDIAQDTSAVLFQSCINYTGLVDPRVGSQYFWFGDTVTHLTKCNTNSKVRAMPA